MATRMQRTAAVMQVTSRTFGKTRDFFVERLGFTVGTEVRYFATLDRDGQTLMLACSRSFVPARMGWAAYFWVDDVEALHAEFIQRGASLENGITEKPYGCRELVAITPDGREIVFGQLTGDQPSLADSQ